MKKTKRVRQYKKIRSGDFIYQERLICGRKIYYVMAQVCSIEVALNPFNRKDARVYYEIFTQPNFMPGSTTYKNLVENWHFGLPYEFLMKWMNGVVIDSLYDEDGDPIFEIDE